LVPEKPARHTSPCQGWGCPYPALVRPSMRFAPQRPLYGSSCVLFSPSCILFALVASSSQSHNDAAHCDECGKNRHARAGPRDARVPLVRKRTDRVERHVERRDARCDLADCCGSFPARPICRASPWRAAARRRARTQRARRRPRRRQRKAVVSRTAGRAGSEGRAPGPAARTRVSGQS